MSYVEIEGGEVVGKGKDAHWVTRIEKFDITGREDRESVICQLCGWSTYPECKKECHNYNNK